MPNSSWDPDLSVTRASLDDRLRVASKAKSIEELSDLTNQTEVPGKSRVLNEGYAWDAPFVLTAASGAYVNDINNNSYLDLGMAAGTAILGHSPDIVIEALESQLRQSLSVLRPTPLAFQYADLLSEIYPCFSSFAYCNSGAEATMRAVRIARAATGRNKVAILAGGWHGGNDYMLVEEDYGSPPDRPKAKPRSAGIPEHINNDIIVLPLEIEAARAVIEEVGNDIGLILVEPVQNALPTETLLPLLRCLRELTERNGILFGFDEIVTGFRIALGGGIERFDITPDLATFGKIAGGGLPIGLVGVSGSVERVVRGQSGDGELPVFMGGTFSANPITLTAGYATLAHLRECGRDIYTQLAERSQAFRQTINEFCELEGIAAYICGTDSLNRILYGESIARSRRERDNKDSGASCHNAFALFCRAAGLHMPSNELIALSICHDEADLEFAARTICSAFEFCKKQGLLGE